MKIGVISLGCAKNLVDTENLLGLLRHSNQEIVTSYQEAEAIIINTCGFIDTAKQEAIETILDTADLKEGNLKKLIVMGCLAKRYKPQLEEEMPEVDRFISIDEYGQMGTILSEVLGERIANDFGAVPRVLSGKPWMAYLQISDGCNNRCSYCAIPFIRGNLHSTPQDEIIKEAERLASIGVKEITLVAQDCSRYGMDFDGKPHLVELLKKLDEVEGIHWIRMLYLYPDEMPDDLVKTVRDSKHILPYFDIPTQNGCDKTLKAMRRRTSRAQILERTSKIKEELPEAVLRTTVIAGFPNETLEDHEENLSMIEQVRWDHLGAFTFSKEEGTAAYAMDDNVEPEEKERRRAEIMMLQDRIAQEKLREKIGMESEVLVERSDPLTGMYIGRSAMQAPDGVDGCVRFRSDEDLHAGEFVTVRFTKISGQNLIGIMIGGSEK